MKIVFLKETTLGDKVFNVGEEAEIHDSLASILIRKGKAKKDQVKSKTAKSNKED